MNRQALDAVLQSTFMLPLTGALANIKLNRQLGSRPQAPIPKQARSWRDSSQGLPSWEILWSSTLGAQVITRFCSDRHRHAEARLTVNISRSARTGHGQDTHCAHRTTADAFSAGMKRMQAQEKGTHPGLGSR